ncbi:MAG: serine/threonine phosphatase [Leptolyngbya sp.]|nr:serine/threonine phosphatase [Leptolyngbya sp.]
MLTCPSCQFQNPSDLGECHRCGQPLQRWHSLWWPGGAAVEQSEAPEVPPYLDEAQRYQRLGHPQQQWTAAGDAVIAQTVLDCHPDRGNPLQDSQDLWLEQPQLDPTTTPEIADLPLQAWPYLALQSDYFPAVPELHDVVRARDQVILVLEDRSTWPRLETLWPTKIDDPLQQTQWLFEITLLWQALDPWQGQITLLNPDRLVLSPNDLLCLSHIDTSATKPNLPALGQVWQRMLLTDSLAPALAIQQLIQALAEGHLTPLERLQEALADLAGQYRSNPVAAQPIPADTPAMPPTDAISDEELLLLIAERDEASDDDSGDQEITQESREEADQDLPTMVLPMKLFSIEEAGQSHPGQQRKHNEDCFFCQTQTLRQNAPHGPRLQATGLYILCDGMGGHAAGEVASQLAVQTLRDDLGQRDREEALQEATLLASVAKANQAIFEANQGKASAGLGRMGTTLVMALVQDLRVAIVHVGDSRVYSYDKRHGLQQITVDHEVGQREIHRGVEPAIAYARPDAYQLTQALGPRDQEVLRPGLSYHDLAEDTLLILCSDGLSDNDLLERHETSHIAPLLSSRANLDQGVADLIQLANEKNGHDNITLILVRLKLRPDLNQLAP